MMNFRTDLAIESREMYLAETAGGLSEIPGVDVDTHEYSDTIRVTRIKVSEGGGSTAIGKPPGTYITIEMDGIVDAEEEEKEEASRAVAEELKKMIEFNYNLRVLVIGLGNEKITPDSLGPYTASKVKVTRHYFIKFNADGDDEMSCVSGLVPGVMGTTGIETSDIIREAAGLTKPDVIIAIDSLAARNMERISTTVQICDTGISPGAGMGNNRNALNEETLGVRVVAIGVPTVIDTKTLILDTLGDYLEDVDKAENHIKSSGLNMVVTSTEIDRIIKDFSDVIAKGINITLHPGIYS